MPMNLSLPDQLFEELGITWPHAIAVVLSAVGIYVAFLLFVRIFGQRVLMAMSTFDVVVTVMLGSVAGRVILGHPPTLTSGILGLATLFILEAVFGQLRSSMRVHKLMNSPARLLMIGQDIQEKTLKRSHITIWELHGALRRAGIRSYQEIACVLHEPGGGISVLRRGVPIDPRLLTDVAGADHIPDEFLAGDDPAGDHLGSHRQG
ncbi:DUF421 domain-containing protein [Kocuria sp. CPCC 205235]|uniref:DUF421 domain-containing protein n=2 Tax=Kocuria TaxID=57493 RepID=UPI0034D4EE5D